MQRLESLLVSGNKLFKLVTTSDDKLELSHEEFRDLEGVLGLTCSYHSDLVFPPEEIRYISMERFGKYIYITTEEESKIKDWVRVHSDADWTCFYIQCDYKLLIHVQPTNVEYNYSEYKEETVVMPNIEKSFEEMKEAKKSAQDVYSSMMNDIEHMASEIAKMDKI